MPTSIPKALPRKVPSTIFVEDNNAPKFHRLFVSPAIRKVVNTLDTYYTKDRSKLTSTFMEITFYYIPLTPILKLPRPPGPSVRFVLRLLSNALSACARASLHGRHIPGTLVTRSTYRQCRPECGTVQFPNLQPGNSEYLHLTRSSRYLTTLRRYVLVSSFIHSIATTSSQKCRRTTPH